MDKELEAKIRDILDNYKVMTLATIRPDGYPQATLVHYVNDNLTLYFATDAASQKAGNLGLNNKVSLAIACETEDAYRLRGLSMSGTAKRVVEPETLQKLQMRLFRKIPEAKRLAPANAQQLAVYEITPVAISLIDYSSGYGKTTLIEE